MRKSDTVEKMFSDHSCDSCEYPQTLTVQLWKGLAGSLRSDSVPDRYSRTCPRCGDTDTELWIDDCQSYNPYQDDEKNAAAQAAFDAAVAHCDTWDND